MAVKPFACQFINSLAKTLAPSAAILALPLANKLTALSSDARRNMKACQSVLTDALCSSKSMERNCFI